MKIADLPKRRRQVVELTVRGYCRQEIADLARIDVKTVHSHMRAALRQLGLQTEGQLFALAARESVEVARQRLGQHYGDDLAAHIFHPFDWLHEALPQ